MFYHRRPLLQKAIVLEAEFLQELSKGILNRFSNKAKRFAQSTAFRSYQCFSLLSLLLLLAKTNYF